MTAHPRDLILPGARTPGAADHVDQLLRQRAAANQIAHLCDTRALHRLLARLSERPLRGRAGCYRVQGEPVVVRVPVRAAAPMVSRTCPPARVAPEMAMLGHRLRKLLTDPPAPDNCRAELAAVLATFFRIHPYMDGNGRIARILFRRAAALLGLPLNDRWTLEHRGYGAALSLMVESYPLSPKPLEAYLDRFFDPR